MNHGEKQLTKLSYIRLKAISGCPHSATSQTQAQSPNPDLRWSLGEFACVGRGVSQVCVAKLPVSVLTQDLDLLFGFHTMDALRCPGIKWIHRYSVDFSFFSVRVLGALPSIPAVTGGKGRNKMLKFQFLCDEYSCLFVPIVVCC